MNNDFEIPKTLTDMLSSANTAPTADMVVKDCTDADFQHLISDRIYGLLTEDSLTLPQIQLLSVLMGAFD